MQEPQPVTLQNMLAARDARAARQRAMTAEHGTPLVCLTMVLPGAVKRGAAIDRGFALGCALVRRQLRAAGMACLAADVLHLPTGSEGYWAVRADAGKLKRIMLDIEEHTPAGRLLDLDVLDESGRKVARGALGYPERTCLLCREPAHACARSRAHDANKVAGKAHALLTEALIAWDAEHIAQLACRALLTEACTTPKPGLVDRRNAGSHKDMDLFTFMAGAPALQPYFVACARAGMAGKDQPPIRTMDALRPLGRLAEGAMLKATGGVNTHKGAVFTLGVLCAALGRLDVSERREPDAVLAAAAAIAAGITARDFGGVTAGTARTHGEMLYALHGITGARGQLEAGLPSVKLHGLPALEAALGGGCTLEQAGCMALLHLIANTQDTALIARGGLEGQQQAADKVKALLAQHPMPGNAAIEDLDEWFISRNLSPGGCADLLAACYLLHWMKTVPEGHNDA